ncbi:MAG: HEPN domain-containing protein [Spirochaetales bacterium]|nr:HEPN domain-containing protein [Spirochaetales bacterium]
MDNNLNDYVKAWIIKANNDMRAATILLESGEKDLPNDAICFHCQQAVEKYLKAFLVFKSERINLTHNLADLVKACMKHDERFKEILEKAEMLTPFAIEIRYPDDMLLPSLSETKDFFRIALEIKEFILAKINIT